MPRIFTWSGKEPSQRNLTVADLQAAKGQRKFTQVTANTSEEAAAAAEAGIDMMTCGSSNVEAVRAGNDTIFLTAAIGLPASPTADDVLREAFRVMAIGADAVFTQRSLDIVSMLAREDIPVMGHLGLVPRKSTWVGGLRAIAKTADEALELSRSYCRLEDAGAVLVESELIASAVMEEITRRTKLITVSLGSGWGGDVIYLFMEDICGEAETRPRHARAYGDLLALRRRVQEERIAALKAFRADALGGQFPAERENVRIPDEELALFQQRLQEGE